MRQEHARPWRHRRRSWSIPSAGQGCSKGSPGSSTHLFTSPFFCQQPPASGKVLSSGQASSFSFYSRSSQGERRQSGQAAPDCQEGMSHVGICLGPPFTHGVGRAVPTHTHARAHTPAHVHTQGTHILTRRRLPVHAHTHQGPLMPTSQAGGKWQETLSPVASPRFPWQLPSRTPWVWSGLARSTALPAFCSLSEKTSLVLDGSALGHWLLPSWQEVAANCQDRTCPDLKMRLDLLEAATSLNLSSSGQWSRSHHLRAGRADWPGTCSCLLVAVL